MTSIFFRLRIRQHFWVMGRRVDGMLDIEHETRTWSQDAVNEGHEWCEID